MATLPRAVSTHSHPKVAADMFAMIFKILDVSTHSHPKVAARVGASVGQAINGFNTQPPEGGCQVISDALGIVARFQHTATRRWLQLTQMLS